jgi:SAM-dependent methyltransferase
MLERARQSAPKDLGIEFALADATVYSFVPASFDVLASRFGVMFFADPALSFANMRKALRPSGLLAFAHWREPRSRSSWRLGLQARAKAAATGRRSQAVAFLRSACPPISTAGTPGQMEPCPLLLDAAIGRGLGWLVQGALESDP